MAPKNDADGVALWQKIMHSTKPLVKKSRVRLKNQIPSRQNQQIAKPENTLEQKAAPDLNDGPPVVDAINKRAPSPQNRIPMNERRKLQSGRQAIEAKLDLHGQTAEGAHKKLVIFLRRQQAQNKRFVLVITGKGERGEGVLRRDVPHWLRQPPLAALVVAFDVAAPRHGDTGALYVHLRRKC